MVPEIKSAWVAALRSGRYVQGTSYLRQTLVVYQQDVETDELIEERRAHLHCCLGVLCELAAAEEVVAWDGDECFSRLRPDDHSPSFLPDTVSRWAGLPLYDRAENLLEERQVETIDFLMTLNDKEFSFDVIADEIEARL